MSGLGDISAQGQHMPDKAPRNISGDDNQVLTSLEEEPQVNFFPISVVIEIMLNIFYDLCRQVSDIEAGGVEEEAEAPLLVQSLLLMVSSKMCLSSKPMANLSNSQHYVVSFFTINFYTAYLLILGNTSCTGFRE